MTSSDWGLLAAIVAIVGLVLVVLVLLLYLATAYFAMLTFRKMGIAGWKAWVPVYNVWLWLEKGNLPGWLALLLLLPSVTYQNDDALFQTLQSFADLGGLAVTILVMVATYRIAPRFGKPKEYFLLVLFPPVLFGLLASSKAKYQG